MARGFEEFPEGHRKEIEERDLADGEGRRFSDLEPQKGAGCRYVMLGGLFLEIFQTVQRFRTVLDLVEDDQGLTRDNGFSE